ncbi:hypothetical protein [Streptomyces sp. NPDC048825]|uniref:hypothetical protein n=1 Tax=Streptomyces sp. NPDC048825 TaxID=3365592 RepID=UPI00371246A0
MRDEKKLLVTYGHNGPWDLDDQVGENRFTVVALLAGPPGLGYLGDHVVLRPAMLVVLACAAFLGPGVETRPRTGCRSVRARRSRREPSHG